MQVNLAYVKKIDPRKNIFNLRNSRKIITLVKIIWPSNRRNTCNNLTQAPVDPRSTRYHATHLIKQTPWKTEKFWETPERIRALADFGKQNYTMELPENSLLFSFVHFIC